MPDNDTGIEFADKTGLGGNRADLADGIINYLDENGPATTPDIVDELHGNYGYETRASLQRTMSDLRKILEDEGMVDCERVESDGSRMTWNWRRA